MSLVPNTVLGKIEFYEAHAPVWVSAAATIGLTPVDATKISNLTKTARIAYDEQLAAKNAAKAATTTLTNAVNAMHLDGSADISRIRAFAESTQDPNVYAKAQIPPPATPTPTPAPGTPMDFAVGLMQSGAVELRWKCNNPVGTQGTIYECRRKIGAGVFTFIGASGVKSFVDDTLPTGAQGVVYEITAVRSTKRGNPAQFNVNFGVGGDGMMFARVENVGGAPMKMAA